MGTIIEYFDIRTGAEYRILTFKILFWQSNRGRISYFYIQNPILTFGGGPNSVFWHSKSYFDIRNRAEYSFFVVQNPILTFELRPNIVFWHSKSYFDFQTGAEYCIKAFNILFWHLKSGRSIIFSLNKTFTSLNWAFLTVHLALVAIATKSHSWTYQAKTLLCILVN